MRPGFLVEWKIDSEFKFGIVQEVTTSDGGDIRVKTPEGKTYWMSQYAPTRVWSPEHEPHLVSCIAAAVEKAPPENSQLNCKFVPVGKGQIGPEPGYFTVGGNGPFWPRIEVTIAQAEAIASALADAKAKGLL